MTLSLKSLSTYRTQLMGIATILILVCHANPMVNSQPNILHKVLNYGNLGVDIFLFLSGFGCWYSLNKRSEVLGFWKRRIVRMIIPYLTITFPFAVFYLIAGRYSIVDFICSLTTFDYWLYHNGAWFIALMIPIYLLSPLLYKLTNKRGGGQKWFGLTIIILLLTVWYFIATEDLDNHDIFANIMGAFSRAPSFLLGMAIAPYIKTDSKKAMYALSALAIPYVILRLFHISVPWMITPLLTLLFAKFCAWLSEVGKTYKALTILGGISLESYLFNIDFNSLFPYLIGNYSSCTLFEKIITYTVIVVLGLVLAYYSRRFINSKVTSRLN